MRSPAIQATIERRLLVNFRVDPDRLTLPAPFRPHLVNGYAIAGVCLIRLGEVRPCGVPPALGITIENAAHRIAVEWDTPDGSITGVYIPRRHSSSRLAVLLGGRVFSGWHHPARFEVCERGDRYRVAYTGKDVEVTVEAHHTGTLTPGSVFDSLDHASTFFRQAPIGYAATPAAGVYDGVELTTDSWSMTPLHLDQARSSAFGDAFVPDSAFLMSGIQTTWCPQPVLTAAP